MEPTALGSLVIGLIVLIVGAELLVRGASRLAAFVGLSPLVIGLTVVAFGTSAPELAISTMAALSGQENIAVGNIVGSNIFNILVILGLSAAITPLVVSQQLIRLDVPLMVGVSVLFFLMAFDGVITTWEGFVLFTILVGYLAFLIRQSKKEDSMIQAEYEQEFSKKDPKSPAVILLNVGLFIAGLIMLVLGSRWLVDGAVNLAKHLGVSELIISLTIVSGGTSLPEVATSIIAAVRGERDIAVGNVIGSNLFNILSVVGISSMVAPQGIDVAPALINFDIPVMIVVAIACLPIFFTGYRISRWEGWLFMGYYIAYTLYLILGATQHDALPIFSQAMAIFIIPLTLITLGLLFFREIMARKAKNLNNQTTT
jgi:cation:H+ antiporter